MTLTVKQILPAQKGEVIVVLRGDQDAFFSRRFSADVATLFTEGEEWEFIPYRKGDWVKQSPGACTNARKAWEVSNEPR